MKEGASPPEEMGEKQGRLQPAVPAALLEPNPIPRPREPQSPHSRFPLGRSWVSHQHAASVLTVWASLAWLQEKRGLGAVFLMTDFFKNVLFLKKKKKCLKINEVILVFSIVLTGSILPDDALDLEYALLAMLFHSAELNSF